MDDLLGEVQSIKSAVSGCENSLSSMEDKVCYEHTLIHLSVNHLLLVIYTAVAAVVWADIRHH